MDRQKIDELLDRAVAAQLDGVTFISSLSHEALASYNGIGPAFLSDEVRAKVSDYLDLFSPAALIHDMRYDAGDGTRAAFNFANIEFYANCATLARREYGLLNWRRYRALAAANVLFLFVSSQFGWVAFAEASRKRLRASAPMCADF